MINNILIEVLAVLLNRSVSQQSGDSLRDRHCKRGGEAFGAPNDRLSAKLESILFRLEGRYDYGSCCNAPARPKEEHILQISEAAGGKT